MEWAICKQDTSHGNKCIIMYSIKFSANQNTTTVFINTSVRANQNTASTTVFHDIIMLTLYKHCCRSLDVPFLDSTRHSYRGAHMETFISRVDHHFLYTNVTSRLCFFVVFSCLCRCLAYFIWTNALYKWIAESLFSLLFSLIVLCYNNHVAQYLRYDVCHLLTCLLTYL